MKMLTAKWENIINMFIIFIALSILYWPLKNKIFPSENIYLYLFGFFLSIAATMLACYLITKTVIYTKNQLRKNGFKSNMVNWISFLLWSLPMSIVLSLWAWDKDSGLNFISFPFVFGVLFSLVFGFLFFYLDKASFRNFLGVKNERIKRR